MTSTGPVKTAPAAPCSAAESELTRRVAAKSNGCIASTTAAPVTMEDAACRPTLSLRPSLAIRLSLTVS
eukprot:scaffold38351_cov63-Phaeocystis_antarctica.AAC.12